MSECLHKTARLPRLLLPHVNCSRLSYLSSCCRGSAPSRRWTDVRLRDVFCDTLGSTSDLLALHSLAPKALSGSDFLECGNRCFVPPPVARVCCCAEARLYSSENHEHSESIIGFLAMTPEAAVFTPL